MSQPTYNSGGDFQKRGTQSIRRAPKALEHKERNYVPKTRPMPLADRPLGMSSSLEDDQTRPMRTSDRPSRSEFSKVDDLSKTTREVGRTSGIKGFSPEVLGGRENLPRRSSQPRQAEPKQYISRESRSNSVPKNVTQKATQRIERQPSVQGYQESRFDHSTRDQPNTDRNSHRRTTPSSSNSLITRPTASKYRPEHTMNQYTNIQLNRQNRSTNLLLATRNQRQHGYDDLSASSSHSNHLAYSQHQQQLQTPTRSQEYQDSSQSQSESSRIIQAKYKDKKDQKMAEKQLKYNELSPEQQQDQDAWATQQLNLIGLCPVGFVWMRDFSNLGYRCAGGGHFVSDQNLVLEASYTGYGFGGGLGLVGAGGLRNWMVNPGIVPFGYGIGFPGFRGFGYPVGMVAVRAPGGLL